MNPIQLLPEQDLINCYDLENEIAFFMILRLQDTVVAHRSISVELFQYKLETAPEMYFKLHKN